MLFYVGRFASPQFGSISTQSLLYRPISLIFTPNYFSAVFQRILSRARCENKGVGVGGGGWINGKELLVDLRAKLF